MLELLNKYDIIILTMPIFYTTNNCRLFADINIKVIHQSFKSIQNNNNRVL